jgi:maltose alpha-D-glucosyltransferase/alpha-amylase
LVALSGQAPTQLAQETIGAYLQSAALLGKRTAEMHLALASRDDDPSFNPEPFTKLYQRSLYQSMRMQARKSFDLLRKQLRAVPNSLPPEASRALEAEKDIDQHFRKIMNRKMSAMRIRCHGDYHLGQVLFTGKDFVIIDFEGEPERPVGERRIKTSPLRDVAGMIRSFHYASHAALLGRVPFVVVQSDKAHAAELWLQMWYIWTAASFLKSYLAEASRAAFLPPDQDELQTLLNAHLLEKTLYELGYELNNRPDWVKIPIEGILHLADLKS